MNSKVVEHCQSCGSSSLASVFFAGYLPPVNDMPRIGERLREQPAYPAELLRCSECTLVQLGLVVDPRVLFPPDYPYTSGTTRILRENFADLAREVGDVCPIGSDDLVVDVGSNDGTLLSNFTSSRVLGIEPTDAGDLAEARGIRTLRAFFDRDAARAARGAHGYARLVTAANVFAHIDGVHEVVEAVLDLLGPGGVFVSESHYLASLVRDVQYDTVYHEHLRYYSLESLSRLLAPHGLEVFHARRIPTHGGSVRAYAARSGARDVLPSVSALLAEERRDLAALPTFVDRVRRSKLGLYSILDSLPGRVFGVGAPSRASTLVNHLALDDSIVECVLEVPGSRKIGRYVPGTRIPVVDESRVEFPENLLLFSWHLADELMPKLRSAGFRGKFVVPLPEPRVVD